MTVNNWKIDANNFDANEISNTISEIDTIDNRIENLYQKAKLPFDIKVFLKYAKQLNVTKTPNRVPYVYKLLEMDYSLGPGGFALRFKLNTRPKMYGFWQLIKYDAIYRPIKYVYMPFGLSYCPAGFSRDITQNACAHVEECVLNLLNARHLKIRPKSTLGVMLSRYPNEFTTDDYDLISTLNNLIYGKTKHKFDVELPRLQLLSLAESLAIYFVCRVIGLNLLQQAGTLDDIKSEINKGRTKRGFFLGQEWCI